ncbi:BtpA/SgcQ family protein, partial [Candidatus Woesearchaeota archaeon]|nr:BtpA/SgcQ family protein [Candidatus Woesearchaeota archaeon]
MLNKIFKTDKPIIGSLHFTPLLGYPNFKNIKKVLDAAIKDLEAFEKGGVNGIIVENNYDVPHKIEVGPETVACMSYLTSEIMKRTKLPVGVSVLWNDYKAALSIARVCGAKFIRVPAFVDSVKTAYGTVIAEPKKVIEYRKKIGAENVLLFTDVQVKHAEMLEERPLSESIIEAIVNKSDAIIITGKWTGDAPNIEELKIARDTAKDFPIFIGSGACKENIKYLL